LLNYPSLVTKLNKGNKLTYISGISLVLIYV